MNPKALQIVHTLVQNGHRAVFAGGWVRDHLLNLTPNDTDIATSALPEEVEALFPKTLAIGKAFGVILVVIDDEQFEVATFRADGEYTDGRRPDSVSFSSLEEDARRRDITINGMFYDPLNGDVIDVVGGRADLEQKIIRFIGDPEQRIKEDRLRLLRVIRFAARLGFEIEPLTFAAVKRNAGSITQVSAERVSEELTKTLRCKDKIRAIELLFQSGLIDYILPEVKQMEGCEQPVDYHPEGCVLRHTQIALSLLSKDASDELLWGTFLHDVGKPPTQTFEDRIRFNGHDSKGKWITEQILKRLKFSNDFVEHVCALVENHMKFTAVTLMRVSKLKRFVNLK